MDSEDALGECCTTSICAEFRNKPKTKPSLNDIEMKILAQKDVDYVTALSYHCFAEEPINKALQTSYEDFLAYFGPSFRAMLEDNVSFVAWDRLNNRYAGCCLNEIDHPTKEDGLAQAGLWCDNEKAKIIMGCMEEIERTTNLFEKYSVSKFIRIQMLSVPHAYGGMGIGRKLLEKSLKNAEDKGFELVVAEATGLYSQKIFQKHNFHQENEIPYTELKKLHQELMLDRMGDHKTLKFFSKTKPFL